MLLVSVLILYPFAMQASKTSLLEFDRIFFLANSGYVLVSDIKDVMMLFKSKVEADADAKVYIMSGDTKVAESGKWETVMCQDDQTVLKAVFDPAVRLPKGKNYRVVVPAGSVHSSDTPTFKSEEYSQTFSVSDDFEG